MSDVSFYILTDSHYVSKKTWVEGKPFTSRERSDQIALKLSPEILDEFLKKIIEDKSTDTVIFLGDNVNNCDMISHYEFRERLEKLVAAGKKVYVIYATHDYSGLGEDKNIFRGYFYTEKGMDHIESMKKRDLFDFYRAYGPAQASSVHEKSGSYAVMLHNKLKMIFIIDNGNGKGYCGLDSDGLDWVTSEIKKSNGNGEYVLLAVHHPLIPPWDIYGRVVEYELYGGYKELRKILCENKVRAVFTGHTHVQNIRRYADSTGRWFFDISTTALVNAAGKMRKVTVDTDKGVCSVKSIGIEKIDGFDTGDETLYEYLYHLNAPGIWEKLVPLAAKDFGQFTEQADGYLPVYRLGKYEKQISIAGKLVRKLKLSAAADLGLSRHKLSSAEKKEAKHKKIDDTVFTMLRHVFTGNAPFTPETVEYKAITGFVGKVDAAVNLLNIKKLKKIIPDGSSLREVTEDFLYNTRTGNDDEITFNF